MWSVKIAIALPDRCPALKYTDYCILNEFEAGRTTGFEIRTSSGDLDTTALRHAAGALIECGIRELVVIHFPEGAFARTLDGRDFWQSSLKLPQKYIAGSAGAGDAFCAGVLMGLHQGWDIQQRLKAGVCAAASSSRTPPAQVASNRYRIAWSFRNGIHLARL